MPKQTFFNLHKEKQENLIKSAKKEFSRVPLNKASVSNIVKNAEIPRGSFYQYFENKEDAFYYLLEKQTKGHKSNFLSTLKENNGDLFDAFIILFRKMLAEFQDQENRDFYKNAFLNMNYKMENKLAGDFSKVETDKVFIEIIAVINVQLLNIEDEREIIHVIQIITAVTSQNLIRSFGQKNSFEETLRNYLFEINLLKKGIYREDSEL